MRITFGKLLHSGNSHLAVGDAVVEVERGESEGEARQGNGDHRRHDRHPEAPEVKRCRDDQATTGNQRNRADLAAHAGQHQRIVPAGTERRKPIGIRGPACQQVANRKDKAETKHGRGQPCDAGASQILPPAKGKPPSRQTGYRCLTLPARSRRTTDGVGWALLARAYVELGRHQEAVPIYEKAMQLIPDDAQMLADYADALGVLNGRKLEGRPEALIQQALKADPRNVKALMLAGTVAYNHKEFGRAASYWEEARTNLPPETDSEAIQEIMAGIAEARELAGGRQAAQVATPAAPKKPAGPAVAISGQVTIAPGLAGKGSPTDTLFVFAREMNGPPMPVSIVRATKKDLPFTFQLDDSTSPMPSRKLSDVGTVVIVARLSKSGEAMPKSGDLQGVSEPMKPGANKVTVVIDREIP